MPINCCPTCHGNYPARIIDVINGKADCPYCSGRKALPGKTSFAALHPDLMEDWDFIANYCLVNPDEILDTYSQKVWCEYYGAAEPPVRCGESHLSGLTEPPQFVY